MPVDFLVNIDVDDLDEGVPFYVDALGLRIGRRFGESAVELLGGPAPIYLLAKKGGTRRSAEPPRRATTAAIGRRSISTSW